MRLPDRINQRHLPSLSGRKRVQRYLQPTYRESLFKSYTTINRLYSLIETGELNVRTDTLRRLISKVLTASNIPFHGEPAIGMQVMGVLETRNLDFRNIILLSLNEGQLPKSGGDSSFIPYNLRKAFGMTTIEHKKCGLCLLFLSTDTTGGKHHLALQHFFQWAEPWRRIPFHAAIACRRTS